MMSHEPVYAEFDEIQSRQDDIDQEEYYIALRDYYAPLEGHD